MKTNGHCPVRGNISVENSISYACSAPIGAGDVNATYIFYRAVTPNGVRKATNLKKTINMPNTYTQIHIHAVFAVQNRISLISKTWEQRLYQYITGIIQNHGHKLLTINGMPDHIHFLFGMRPTQSLSDLMRDVKGDSSLWINKNKFAAGKFSWQEGYGGFSYSKSQITAVANYIEKQELHHKKITFIEEYTKILQIGRASCRERV